MLIDLFAEGWFDELHQRAATLPENASLYLLIDGVFMPGLYRDVRAVAGEHFVTLLFEALPACSAAVREVSPFLLKLHAQTLPRLLPMLETCSGRPMVSLIETTEPLDELTARLSAWCVVYADNQRFNFRFPDTRRLPGIFNALTSVQQGQMTGPATRWSYVGRFGTWSELPLVASNASAAEEPPVLTDAQFARMVDDSEADEILASLAMQGRLPAGRLSQLHETAHRALRIADATSLPQGRRTEWCEVSLGATEFLDHTTFAEQMRRWRETLPA